MKKLIGILCLVILSIFSISCASAGSGSVGDSPLVPIACEVAKLRVDARIAERFTDPSSAECVKAQAEAHAAIDQFCNVLQGEAGSVADVVKLAARKVVIDQLVAKGVPAGIAELLVAELERAAAKVKQQ
jgi:hypothetical protein